MSLSNSDLATIQLNIIMFISSFIVVAVLASIAWTIGFIKEHAVHRRKMWQPSQIAQFCDIFGIGKIFEVVRAVMDGTILYYTDNFYTRYGDTYTSSLMGTKITITRDPDNIKQVFTSHARDYDTAKGMRMKMFEQLAPGTVAATDGEEWKENRTRWRRHFQNLSQLHNMSFYETSFQKLFSIITSSGKAVDMQPLALEITTDIAIDLAAGKPSDYIDPESPSPDSREYITAFERATPMACIRGWFGPFARFLPQSGYKANCDKVKDQVDRMIQNSESFVKREKKESAEASPKRPCFLDTLLAHTDDTMMLKHNVISMIMTNESMSRAFSHTIFLLSRDPVVYEKLRKSVLDKVGYEKPTYEQLTKFTYLNNILSESMRLLPPNPINMRRANTDTWLPKGGGKDGNDRLLIRKGQRVILSIFSSHRNPAVFGKDASEFRPERWDDLKKDTPGYFPFSLGPRACVGRQLSLNVLAYMMVRLAQTYLRMESRDDADFAARLRLSMSSQNGVWVGWVPDPHAPFQEELMASKYD